MNRSTSGNRVFPMLAAAVVIGGYGGAIALAQPSQERRSDREALLDSLAEAVVVLERIEVRSADDRERITIADFSDQDGVAFDLLWLQDGQTDLLDGTDIPSGDYDQIRLIVERRGEATLTEGDSVPLYVPTKRKSGIKLKVDFTVAEEAAPSLLLDVDLSRAFNRNPRGWGRWTFPLRWVQFRPTIPERWIEVIASDPVLETGSVNGSVLFMGASPLADVLVTVYDADGNEVASTFTLEDGTYVVTDLPPGVYEIWYTMLGFEQVVVSDVEVVAGEEVAQPDVSLFPME